MSERPEPPFTYHEQPSPGLTAKMPQRPDHGEHTYRGSQQLAGRRAIVTGGDSGIGAAVVIAFAREGADVVMAYLPEEEHDARSIADAVQDAPGRVVLHPGDLAEHDARGELVQRALEEFGGLDTLVCNQAHQDFLPSLADMTMENWRRHFEINVHASFDLVRRSVPHMPVGSTITITFSVNAAIAIPQLTPYSATKGALESMVRGLAQLLAEQGIRVNAVAPGPVWTPIQQSSLNREMVESMGQDVPMGRPGQPAELASAYVMFAASSSGFTTGAVLPIAGGLPIR